MYDIEILSAPSILGLRSTGVDELGKSLLDAGLAEKLQLKHPVVDVPTFNAQRSHKRDTETHCLNPGVMRDFSLILGKAVTTSVDNGRFPLVLGGDCSILIGIMPALKAKGIYGIIFIDAHADFYEPEKSVTGEVADMDLAIITGRGPEILTDIQHLRPYVLDEHVVHVGQRDWEETKKYGSQDIRDTIIKCFDLDDIGERGIDKITADVLRHIAQLELDGFWIHFDTDVLSDDINPAVDYRLPGGLQFRQTEYLIQQLLKTGRMTGMSVTIYNRELDGDGQIARNITESLGRTFDLKKLP
jgi:arginase